MDSPSIVVRLAQTPLEIEEAQRLRYRVFYEEGKALGASPAVIEQKRDFDHFDQFCKHLIAIDQNRNNAVVGSYRLLSREAAEKSGGFFSSSEYDMNRIEKSQGNLLELGRACVDEKYRGKGLVQTLWKAIATYVKENDIRFLFGVANFPTTEIKDIQHALSYLHYNFLAEESICPCAREEGYIPLNQLEECEVNPLLAQEQMTPFIKGYMRVGGSVGLGAFFDKNFGSIDVCIILETCKLKQRYNRLYERDTL